MIYLDYAANTPVDKKVLKEYNKITKKYYANPNSLHKCGVKAKYLIDESSEYIANYFATKKENIIYTSGASEANNMIIKGICERYKNKGKHIIISSIEHSSIVSPVNFLTSQGFEVSVVGLNKKGEIDIDELKKLLRKDTILVSICSVDSELGTIQPIKKIANLLKKYPNTFFHTDATQAIGKINMSYDGVDFLTFAPHKFYGLNGIGVLINFNNVKFIPLIHGGKSTTVFRSGTPMTANIVACAYALKRAVTFYNKKHVKIEKMNKFLLDNLKSIDELSINTPNNSIPNTINISVNDASSVFNKLNKLNICVSRQSACSLAITPSKSVLAITGDEKKAMNSIRISISHLTKKCELKQFIKKLKEILNEDN